jgi:hypothetical protein
MFVKASLVVGTHVAVGLFIAGLSWRLMSDHGFLIGSLRKDKTNVVKVTFVSAYSFKKYIETFINVEIEFVRVASSKAEEYKQAE